MEICEQGDFETIHTRQKRKREASEPKFSEQQESGSLTLTLAAIGGDSITSSLTLASREFWKCGYVAAINVQFVTI